MGFAKKWTPPSIPYRDNLVAWKAIFKDLHENLLLAGLLQTETPDQLDIDSVSTLPVDGAYAGFIEYAFNDALQAEAPIILKLYFGCGTEGLGGNNSRSRTPRILCHVYFKGANIVSFSCPQAFNAGSASANSQLTTVGFSALTLNYTYGFLGVSYGIGSRNKPFAYNGFGDYYGSTFTLFIQRSMSNAGYPTNEAVGVYSPNLDGNLQSAFWTHATAVLPLARSTYSNGITPVTRTDMAPRVGRDGFASGVDSVLLEPIYIPSTPPKPLPFLYSYRNTAISPGVEFEFNPITGAPKKFVALGNENCISVDSVDGQRAGLAMLFE